MQTIYCITARAEVCTTTVEHINPTHQPIPQNPNKSHASHHIIPFTIHHSPFVTIFSYLPIFLTYSLTRSPLPSFPTSLPSLHLFSTHPSFSLSLLQYFTVLLLYHSINSILYCFNTLILYHFTNLTLHSFTASLLYLSKFNAQFSNHILIHHFITLPPHFSTPLLL